MEDAEHRLNEAPSPLKSSLLRLPLELLAPLFGQLSFYDTASLALTCKTLFNAHSTWCIWSSRPSMSWRLPPHGLRDSSHIKFLTGLARDLPLTHEFCFQCVVLHPRLPPGHEGVVRLGAVKKCQSIAAFRPVVFFKTWFFVFSDVYKVMQRHFLGEPHGMSLAKMAISTEWEAWQDVPREWRPDLTVFRKLDIEPGIYILSDQLHLHIVQRLWFRPTKASRSTFHSVLKHHLAESYMLDPIFTTCLHEASTAASSHFYLGYDKRTEDVFRKLIYKLYPPQDENGKFHKSFPFSKPQERRMCDPPRRCVWCTTERMVTTIDHGRDIGTEVVVDVWQNLGSCKYPSQAGWMDCWCVMTTNPNVILERELQYVEDRGAFVGFPGQSAIKPSSNVSELALAPPAYRSKRTWTFK